EAYQLYLQGRYQWAKRRAESIKAAVDRFEAAIAKDPEFALAYAGLADCYTMLSSYGLLKPAVAFPRAREAAVRAVQLDETLAEAHASLALVKLWYEWD